MSDSFIQVKAKEPSHRVNISKYLSRRMDYPDNVLLFMKQMKKMGCEDDMVELFVNQKILGDIEEGQIDDRIN